MSNYELKGTTNFSIDENEASKITKEYLKNVIIGENTFINTEGRRIWLIGFEGCMGTKDVGPASDLQMAANKIIKHLNGEVW